MSSTRTNRSSRSFNAQFVTIRQRRRQQRRAAKELLTSSSADPPPQPAIDATVSMEQQQQDIEDARQTTPSTKNDKNKKSKNERKIHEVERLAILSSVKQLPSNTKLRTHAGDLSVGTSTPQQAVHQSDGFTPSIDSQIHTTRRTDLPPFSTPANSQRSFSDSKSTVWNPYEVNEVVTAPRAAPATLVSAAGGSGGGDDDNDDDEGDDRPQDDESPDRDVIPTPSESPSQPPPSESTPPGGDAPGGNSGGTGGNPGGDGGPPGDDPPPSDHDEDEENEDEDLIVEGDFDLVEHLLRDNRRYHRNLQIMMERFEDSVSEQAAQRDAIITINSNIADLVRLSVNSIQTVLDTAQELHPDSQTGYDSPAKLSKFEPAKRYKLLQETPQNDSSIMKVTGGINSRHCFRIPEYRFILLTGF